MSCPFCEPEIFGERKLSMEHKYWYLVVPEEIGQFGQVLLVVRNTDDEHITDISDPRLAENRECLLSIIKGIHVVSAKIKKGLRNEEGKKVEKVYVLTQCEGDSHLHFHLYPRFEGDSKGNEFLYECELEEARWQEREKRPVEGRIQRGRRILARHEKWVKEGRWKRKDEYKNEMLVELVHVLNRLL